MLWTIGRTPKKTTTQMVGRTNRLPRMYLLPHDRPVGSGSRSHIGHLPCFSRGRRGARV